MNSRQTTLARVDGDTAFPGRNAAYNEDNYCFTKTRQCRELLLRMDGDDSDGERNAREVSTRLADLRTSWCRDRAKDQQAAAFG